MLFKPITGAFKESALLVHSSTKVQKYKNSQNISSSQWKNKKKLAGRECWKVMRTEFTEKKYRRNSCSPPTLIGAEENL